jgi:hypothetical protein
MNDKSRTHKGNPDSKVGVAKIKRVPYAAKTSRNVDLLNRAEGINDDNEASQAIKRRLERRVR